jgi:hypothetical protein
MTNTQSRPRETSSNALPLLTCKPGTNWVSWSKHLKHINTVNGIANDEFQNEQRHVNPRTVRTLTLTVPDPYEDANGNIIHATRPWNPVRDGRDLQDRIKEWERKNRKD